MSQASSLVSLNLGVSNARHLRQERHRSGAVTSRPSIRALADTVPCSARRRWGLPASPLQGHSCPPCRWETLAFWAVRSDFTNPASHDAVGFSAASARLPPSNPAGGAPLPRTAVQVRGAGGAPAGCLPRSSDAPPSFLAHFPVFGQKALQAHPASCLPRAWDSRSGSWPRASWLLVVALGG